MQTPNDDENSVSDFSVYEFEFETSDPAKTTPHNTDCLVLRIQANRLEHPQKARLPSMYVFYDQIYDQYVIRGHSTMEHKVVPGTSYSFGCDSTKRTWQFINTVFHNVTETATSTFHNYTQLPVDSDEITTDVLEYFTPDSVQISRVDLDEEKIKLLGYIYNKY